MSEESPKQQYKNMLDRFSDEIQWVDRETPWGSGVEPDWWLNMMDLQKEIQRLLWLYENEKGTD